MGVIALGRSSVSCGADFVCRSPSRMAGRRVDSAPPRTSVGMIAAARAANATGRFDEGARIIRALWRDGDFDHSTETLIQREFGASLTRADHKYRADRLLYVESFESALRAAGADIIALARARIAAARGQLTPALRMA